MQSIHCSGDYCHEIDHGTAEDRTGS